MTVMIIISIPNREEGKLSLVHKLTNKPSNHGLGKELKEKVTELINQEKYKDFGLTLLSEYLNKYERIDINHETLRNYYNRPMFITL
jgi:hypothetical protein